MNELLSKSLSQIVNSNHRAASVFEKYNLDFCCKGKRTLAQACTESAILTENVVAELENINASGLDSTTTNYQAMSLTQLAEHIVETHHKYVKNEMPAILSYLQKVNSKHGDRHPELNKIFQLFVAVKEEMEYHMQKEESVLFPRIKETEHQLAEGKEPVFSNAYLLAPIHMMEQEHDHAGSMLAEIRQLTGVYNPPADACTTYRLCYASLHAFELDLHHHVHLENNILFPKALAMVGEDFKNSLN